jgi:DNA-binding transcriptional regulator YdaS (Cro superfamily)
MDADDISAGLRQAINQAGGLRALARALGISQNSLAEWRRVPANRLVQVEAVTGIDRKVLRPDLYREAD